MGRFCIHAVKTPCVQRSGESPTYSRNHSSHKIKSPCKIPSWPQGVSPDPGGDGCLVLPQEGVELPQADVKGLAEVEERPVPAAACPQLRGPLYGREDRSAAQQVHSDEEGEQHETAVVLVEVQGAAALQTLGRHHPNFSTTRAVDSDTLHIGGGSQSSPDAPWKPPVLLCHCTPAASSLPAMLSHGSFFKCNVWGEKKQGSTCAGECVWSSRETS